MEDKNKLTNEELTDEQMNKVTGGDDHVSAGLMDFTCDDCKKRFTRAVRLSVGRYNYCVLCFEQNHSELGRAPRRR
jgi:bacteriocin-like protein